MEDEDLETRNIYLHGTYRTLRRIKLFYDLGEYEMAYDEAVEGFNDIDHVIPEDVWLKIGGKIDASGAKIKRRRFLRKQRMEMDYKKCMVLIPILKSVIKKIPPKGKLYSRPWLWDFYHMLMKSRGSFIKELDFTAFKSAPEIDTQLIKECFKWLDKYKEYIDYWHNKKTSSDTNYEFLSSYIIGYEYFLKQRDKKGIGSFIDILYPRT